MTMQTTEALAALASALADAPGVAERLVKALLQGDNPRAEGQQIIVLGDVINVQDHSIVINHSTGATVTLQGDDWAALARAAIRERKGAQQAASVLATEGLLARDARLELHGKPYLVRELIARRAFGPLAVRTARASDLSMERTVGIRQVAALVDTPATRAVVHRAATEARALGHVARDCEHVPQVHDVIVDAPGTVWVVFEWVQGTSVDELLSQDGALPAAAGLAQLLSWAVDGCEALAALHRRRLSHPGAVERSLWVTRGRRGAVLVDPGFVDPPGPLHAAPVPFDRAADVRDLAAAVYRVAAHQAPGGQPASAFNPAVPPQLDQALDAALGAALNATPGSGRPRGGAGPQAYSFRRALIAARQAL